MLHILIYVGAEDGFYDTIVDADLILLILIVTLRKVYLGLIVYVIAYKGYKV